MVRTLSETSEFDPSDNQTRASASASTPEALGVLTDVRMV